MNFDAVDVILTLSILIEWAELSTTKNNSIIPWICETILNNFRA